MLALATGNAHKLEEFGRQLGIKLISPSELGIQLDVEETGDTFEENSRLKAVWLSAHARMPALADDSGLVVDALGGEPGVRSARYGGEGLNDADRRRLLLRNMQGQLDRTARFVCVLCLSIPGSEPVYFRGECEGRILDEERGTGGFGYDPVFLDPESGLTFAELPGQAKDSRSHRGRAIAEFKAWLSAGGEELLRL